jgi:hypothetical protein
MDAKRKQAIMELQVNPIFVELMEFIEKLIKEAEDRHFGTIEGDPDSIVASYQQAKGMRLLYNQIRQKTKNL